MSLPSITVITPCLNAARTVAETLESVRAQDYPAIQHLVMDGGSTDGTAELARAAAGVQVVSRPDGGRVEAANRGVELATGEVIAWLNADDVYEPGALRVVGAALEKNPGAPWATGYCRIVDASGAEIRRGVTGYKNWLLRHYGYGLHLTQNFVSDPATFVRRSALDAAGRLDPAYRTAHDYDLWLRVSALGEPLVLRSYLARFRMAEGSLSMEEFEEQFREHQRIARTRGSGHRLAVGANVVASRAIVTAYRLARLVRRARS